MNGKEYLESVASDEHEQWMDWSKGIAQDLEKIKNLLNDMKVSEVIKLIDMRLERWESLWVPYEELTEEMKEADRRYAMIIMDNLGISYDEKAYPYI